MHITHESAITNRQFFRTNMNNAPQTSQSFGNFQNTFNPSRYHSSAKMRYNIPQKGSLKNTDRGVFTNPHDFKRFPNRLKKKENAISVSAYPITQEKDFDVYYPTMNERGQVSVHDGMQNMGRRAKEDMTRSEFPLVPPTAPRLNLSKVNFKKNFFRKDYRVNNEEHHDRIDQGYDKGPKKLDHRFLERGEKEIVEYDDYKLNQNNFTAPGTRDYNKIMSHRGALMQDSHGAHYNNENKSVPMLYSNMNYGHERTQ